jgi:uncharacterized protein YkwD
MVAMLVLAACGGSGGSGGSGGDSGDGSGSGSDDGESGGDGAAGPGDGSGTFTTISRSPEADTINRALSTHLVIGFSKALMPVTLDDEAITVKRGAHTVGMTMEYIEGETEVSISFPELLKPDTTYKVTISSSLMAADGDIFTPEEWQFHTAGNVGATAQEVIDDCMSDRDLVMLNLVNNTRSRQRLCGGSTFEPVAPLAWHCSLADAARNHSHDMSANGFFSHTGSDGLDAGYRINASGYLWRAYAENIAAGQNTVEGVTQSWLASPGHCKNIMSPSVIEMGAASAEGNGMHYSKYWTQVFAYPQSLNQ